MSSTPGTAAGHSGPTVIANERSLSRAPSSIARVFCSHVGVPQPHLCSSGSPALTPSIANATTSAPPAPPSFICRSSARSSASSVAASGCHQRYFGRTLCGGSARLGASAGVGPVDGAAASAGVTWATMPATIAAPSATTLRGSFIESPPQLLLRPSGFVERRVR